MTESGPALREATAGDLEALCELERISFGEPWSRAGLASFVARPGALVLLAEQAPDPGVGGGSPASPQVSPPAANPVAYAAWILVADEAELLRLAVEPAHRGFGFARALLARGAERLAAAGCTTCFLEVRADNHPAIALYEHSGFHRIGQRPRYYRDGTSALLYAASLGRAAIPAV